MFRRICAPGAVDFDFLGMADFAPVENTVDCLAAHFQMEGIPQFADFQMERVPGCAAARAVTGTPRFRNRKRLFPFHADALTDAIFVMPIRTGIDSAFQSWHNYLLLFLFFAGKRINIFKSLLKSMGRRGYK